MADPDFLNREFTLDRVLTVFIFPGVVLLNSLRDMVKISETAVLIVTGENKFKIRTFPSTSNAYGAVIEMLDMESSLIFDPSNSDGFCLHFNINVWLQRLHDPFSLEPISWVSIRKQQGSSDLICILGGQQYKYGQHMIELGNAQFVKAQPIHKIGDIALNVEVTMSSEQFREFIQSFTINYNHPDARIHLAITKSTISWDTPATIYDYSAEEYVIKGLAPGESHQFPVRWNKLLYEDLCSISTGFHFVELSVFQHFSGAKWYQFRFFSNVYCPSFTHLEQVRRPW